MKKLLCLAMATLLLLAMVAGCAAKPTEPSAPAEPAKNEPPASSKNAEPAAKSPTDIKVALVLVQGLGDLGPMDDMNAKLEQAKADFGVQTSVYEALEPAKYEEALRSFAQEGYDLIVTAFAGMVEPVKRVAPQFPNTKFTIIYCTEDFGMPNVNSVNYASWESNYIVGVGAGVMTKSGKLGHIIGAEDDSIIANYHAFLAGAKTVKPDVTVERVNANTFDDPAKGKEIGLNLIGKGVDVLLGDAAKTCLGIIDAAKEKDKFVIADTTSHAELAPKNVIADTLLSFGMGVYSQAEAVVKGTFQSGVYVADIKSGLIGYIDNTLFAANADPDNAALYLEAQAKMKQAADDIKSGKLVVERDTSK